MVALVINDGWTIEAATGRFQVDVKTVVKWHNLFRDEGLRRAAGSVQSATLLTECETARVSTSDRRDATGTGLG